MKVSIFGIGYVGAVSAVRLANSGHQVVAVDLNPERVAAINRGHSPVSEAGLSDGLGEAVASGRLTATTDARAAVLDSEMSLVCVGTPSLEDGDFDLAQVGQVCRDIGETLAAKLHFHGVVIRSTLLPGTLMGTLRPILEAASGKVAGRDFGLAIYPEFMREGSAIRDYDESETILFGCTDPATEALCRALTRDFKGDVRVTDPATAEAVKLASNAWHAVKVSFANEIGAVSKTLGLDGQEVMRILCADHRLNLSAAYLRPGFAYGGSCLPKDLRALNFQMASAGVELPLLTALPRSNALQIERVLDLVELDGRSKVALLGLAFKAGTTDLRESPAAELAEGLIARGHDLLIFDRAISTARSPGADMKIDALPPHLAALLTTDLQALADHAEILILLQDDLGGSEFPTLRPDQLVIDVARIDAALKSGARYAGLCW